MPHVEKPLGKLAERIGLGLPPSWSAFCTGSISLEVNLWIEVMEE
ncbi:MAG: hypothetical protein V7K88_21540 [Nostoc sp.]